MGGAGQRDTLQALTAACSRPAGIDLGRSVALELVFRAFDLDGDGRLARRELLALGVARRVAGQRASSWTEQKNMALMDEASRL